MKTKLFNNSLSNTCVQRLWRHTDEFLINTSVWHMCFAIALQGPQILVFRVAIVPQG